MKIANSILSYNLSPAQIRIYCAILSLTGKRDSVNLKLDTIAAHSNLSARTVQRELPVLCSQGLLVKANRFGKDIATGQVRKLANRYTVTKLPGAYFNIDSSVISDHALSSSAFHCYLLLCKQRNHANLAFPSLTQITAQTGISRTTVVRALKELENLNLLIKKLRTRLCGAFGHNHYFLQGIIASIRGTENSVQKKTHTTAETVMCAAVLGTAKQICKTFVSHIISHIETACKGLFSGFSYFLRE